MNKHDTEYYKKLSHRMWLVFVFTWVLYCAGSLFIHNSLYQRILFAVLVVELIITYYAGFKRTKARSGSAMKPFQNPPFHYEVTVSKDSHFFQQEDEKILKALVEELKELENSKKPIPLQQQSLLGRADWIFDPDLNLHIPSCSHPKGSWRCGKGPLTGDQIWTGNCGEHEDIHIVEEDSNG